MMDDMKLPTQKDMSDVNDVMLLIGKSRAKAYRVIHDLNAELKKKGFMTINGRVPTKYLRKRMGLL